MSNTLKAAKLINGYRNGILLFVKEEFKVKPDAFAASKEADRICNR